MATGLDSPPENDEQKGALFDSGTPQGVYDDEFQKIRERSLADVDSDNSSDLKFAEESAGAPSLTDAEEAEKNLTDTSDQVGSGYRHEGQSTSKRKIKSRLSGRQKAAGGGILALLIGGTISIGSIIQGPLQIIHFAQLLQGFHFSINDDFMDGRSARMIRNLARGTAYKTNLGYFSNKLADRFEKRMINDIGLRSVYDGSPGKGGRFLGYEVVDADKARNILIDFEKDGVPTDGSAGSNARTPDGNKVNGRFIDLSDQKFRSKRSAVTAVNKATNTGKVSSSISARLLKKRGGIDFHPLKNTRRKTTDNMFDWRRQRKEERADRHRTGSNTVRAAQAEVKVDDEGNASTNSDAEKASQEARAVLEEIEGTDKSNLRSISSNVVSKLGGAAAAVGIMCTAKSLGTSAEDMQFAQIETMMRMGGGIVTTGNQVMSGQDVNVEELGVVISDLYDEETKTSWTSARSIQYEMGKEMTGADISPNVKPDHLEGKPLVFRILDGIPGLSSACSVGDFISGLPVVKQFGELTTNAINYGLGAFGYSIEEFTYSIVQMLAGETVNTHAAGSELGNLVNYGARMAANEQAIATGGRELTDSEFQKLTYESKKYQNYEFQQQSLIARVFNPYESRSLVGQALINTPVSPSAGLSNIAQMPALIIGSISNNFSSLLTPAAAATQHNYDYGFQRYGFAFDDQQDTRFDDPFENAKLVEPKLDDHEVTDSDGNVTVIQGLNNKYGWPCFGIRVNPNGTRSIESKEGAARYQEIEGHDDCQMENKTAEEKELFMRYRFYVTDFITDLSLTCYEGLDDNACAQLGLGGAAFASDATPVAGEIPSGSAQELAQQILAKNDRITFTTSFARQAVVDTAEGREASIESRCYGSSNGRETAPLSATLLGVILQISEKYEVGYGYFTNGCHSDGSSHYSGRAVDINRIDGRRATGGNADRAFMHEITGILPDGSGMGEVQCSSIPINPINNVRLFNDSCNHIHINVPN